MNSTAYGLICAMNSTRAALPFATECEIRALGVTWTASVEFAASCYDGEWTIEDYQVEIVAKGRENTDHWTEVDYTELPDSAFRDIESACMKELSTTGSQEDDSYDAWKERELESHLENLSEKFSER